MAIAQIYSFDAYGNALGFDTAEALTEFLYSGEQFDSKIGQQYLRARYYDPATGRFNRLDPFFGNLTDPQSLHNYLYSHDDPINGTDPSGNFICTLGVLGAISLISYFRARGDATRVATGVTIIEQLKRIPSVVNLLKTGTTAIIGTEELLFWSLYLRSFSLVRSVDDLVSTNQHYFNRVNAVISRNKTNILDSAARHGVPPALLASVLYAELWHRNVIDTFYSDDPNRLDRSIGIAQIRIDTIMHHIEGYSYDELSYEGKPHIYDGYITADLKPDVEKIRVGLLDEKQAIDLLAREIVFHSIRCSKPLSQWAEEGNRQYYVEGFTTSKDKELRPFSEPTEFGTFWGYWSYQYIKNGKLLGEGYEY
jgi:RHS repeat-associated protein